jgi:hypothetical protein
MTDGRNAGDPRWERAEGSLTDGGSLPGDQDDPRRFGGLRETPCEADEADPGAAAEKEPPPPA